MSGDALHRYGGCTLQERLYLTLLYQRCLGSTDSDYIIREMHEEIYRDHGRGRASAHKIIRHGYFWPTIYEDA